MKGKERVGTRNKEAIIQIRNRAIEISARFLGYLLQISILLARQETGAILVDIGQLTVTQDLGVGVIDLETAQQGYQGGLLRWGARVGRAPLFV